MFTLVYDHIKLELELEHSLFCGLVSYFLFVSFCALTSPPVSDRPLPCLSIRLDLVTLFLISNVYRLVFASLSLYACVKHYNMFL